MKSRLGPAAGRDLVDNLGFLLVPGPPSGGGTAYLFVALRRRPSLRHFDPERIDYWVTANGHGAPALLDLTTAGTLPDTYAWGLIRIVDRLGIANDFASFGGRLETDKVDDVGVTVFSSGAPIVACGGHSQNWAPSSQGVAGFIARLRAAADPSRELERQLAALSPEAIYAAYVATELGHVAAPERLVDWSPVAHNVMRREEHRLRTETPDAWKAGASLAEQLAEGWELLDRDAQALRARRRW